MRCPSRHPFAHESCLPYSFPPELLEFPMAFVPVRFSRVLAWCLFAFLVSVNFAFAQDSTKQDQQDQGAIVAPPAKLIFDAKLEAALRHAVYEKRGTKEPLTEDDLRKVFVLEADGQDIADLRGLQYCRNLHLLKLSNNKITDISPLADLPRLQSLDLKNNQIEDISPLASDTALQYLELSGNQVGDISAVAKLQNLSALYLADNSVADLSPLAELPKLKSLYLERNQVTDLSPLKNVTGLTSLDLTGNQVADLSPLNQQTQLRYLLVEDNKLADLAALVKFASEDAAGSRRVAPFLNLYIAGNPLSEAAKSDQLAALKEAGVRVHEEPAR